QVPHLSVMDNDEEDGDAGSVEELERMRLILKQELGSTDDSSSGSESDSEPYEDSSSNDDESSSDEFKHNHVERNEEEENSGCPAKRMKLEDGISEDELDDTLLYPQSNAECRSESFEGTCDKQQLESKVDEVYEGPSQMHESRLGDNYTCDERSQLFQSNGCPLKSEQGDEVPLKRKKRVPEYRGTDFVLPLPEGWIETVHDSGIPIYMHRCSRVVSLSRPYVIGNESFRRHSIPIGSIPCEQQRRMKDHRENARITLQDGANSQITIPQVELKTLNELRDVRVSPDELYERAKETFCIKEIMVYKFKDWKTIREDKKREYRENAMKEESTLNLDGKNAMITVAAGCGNYGNKMMKRGHILNTAGKTSVTMLHEYVQKVLKGQIEYQYAQVKSSIKPYSAICYLKTKRDSGPKKENGQNGENSEENGRFVIGKGSGTTKKESKCIAATNALKVLVPGLNIDVKHIVRGNMTDKESVELFDLLPIDDDRVSAMSEKTGNQQPFAILQECLRSNAAWGNTNIDEKCDRISHHQHELTMKVGKHEVQVTCSNKREGRQKCAQNLLKKLHPALDTWGSILRLYSSCTMDEQQETKKVRDEVVRLAPNGTIKGYTRNEAVLTALRSEMNRVYGRKGRMERKEGLLNTRLSIERGEEEKWSEEDPLPAHSIDL
ncbi:hypothetical protein PFISCL1PPCAC_19790, partial [Pristionchus fissidentatus]